MTSSRLRLGQLLVDARMITPEALEDVLAAQQKDQRRLGTLLVERGHVSEVQLTQILSHQLSVPWVSLLKIEFSRQLLNLVPRDLADKYCLLPIFVRRVRGHGDTLYIAMDDPTNEEALRACGAYAGLAVRPMIAPPSDIRSAIRAYYGGPTAETEPPPPPSDATPAAHATAPAPARPAAPPRRAQTLRSALHDELAPDTRAVAFNEAPPTVREPSRPPPDPSQAVARAATAGAEADPVIELTGARKASPLDERPAPIPAPRGKTPRMVSLTLLDGTTITLPARAQKRGTGGAKPTLPSRKDERPIERRSDPAIGERKSDPAVGERKSDPAVGERKSDPAIGERKSDPGFGDRASDPGNEAVSSLTARDLVAALRAVADGADASAVLGDDVRWETMFAALLSVLLKKQLIADWEFVEELNRLQKR